MWIEAEVQIPKRSQHPERESRTAKGIRSNRRFIEYFSLKNETISAKKLQTHAFLREFLLKCSYPLEIL